MVLSQESCSLGSNHSRWTACYNYNRFISNLNHILDNEINFEPPQLAQYIHVVNGNALLHSILGIPENVSGIAETIFFPFTQIYQRVDFVTDTYNDTCTYISIKSAERSRRGVSDSFLLKGPQTKISTDWKGLLCNGQNKFAVMKLMHSKW